MSRKDIQDFTAAETVLTHAGRHPQEQFGFVNTPVYRGSTVLYPDYQSLRDNDLPFDYGRTGSPSTRAVEDVVTALEGAAATVLAPSGLAAISLAFFSVVKAGDHVLIPDSVYGPTRRFVTKLLSRLDVEGQFYDPRLGAGIEALVTERTSVIYVESPGSLTFEVQDLPAIAAVARRRDIVVIADNSWATPLFHRPLALGADIVVHAGTKMFVGHSDAMFGTVSSNERHAEALKNTHLWTGTCASPDDCFLAARGLRTLALRMQAHNQRTTELAAWIERQEGVARVLHPGLASHPDHAVFERDFSGSGCLFSIVLEPGPDEAVAAMVDNMDLFGMGYSWGGYESLLLPAFPARNRTAVAWRETGPLIRLHIGLEDLEDLRSDLEAGLSRYRAAL